MSGPGGNSPNSLLNEGIVGTLRVGYQTRRNLPMHIVCFLIFLIIKACLLSRSGKWKMPTYLKVKSYVLCYITRHH